MFDKSERNDGTFSRTDFAYDEKGDAYVCPAGKQLHSTVARSLCHALGVTKDSTASFTAPPARLPGLPFEGQCCPHEPARKIPRSIHEAARDKARAIAKTEAYVVSRRQRKKVEMLFAHLKRILRLDRLRLRGPSGARDEFLLAATAQNLRKLAKLISAPVPIMAT